MTRVGEREPDVNHNSKGAEQRRVSVISYHQLSAPDDSDETLTVGHMQALTLTLPTSKMLVCDWLVKKLLF